MAWNAVAASLLFLASINLKSSVCIIMNEKQLSRLQDTFYGNVMRFSVSFGTAHWSEWLMDFLWVLDKGNEKYTQEQPFLPEWFLSLINYQFDQLI